VLVQLSGSSVKEGISEEAIMEAFEKTSVGPAKIFREATSHGWAVVNGKKVPYGLYSIVSKNEKGISKIIFLNNRKGHCLWIALIAPEELYNDYEAPFANIVRSFKNF